MSQVQIQINEKDVEKIFKAFLQWGEPLNHAIDTYMITQARPFNAKVRRKIPVSERNKDHARHTEKSLTYVDLWMGFASRTNDVSNYKKRNKYGYLFFPETGTGYTQKRKGAQRFFERTVEEEQGKILKNVTELVENFIMRTLK